jgi:hypothetical protein
VPNRDVASREVVQHVAQEVLRLHGGQQRALASAILETFVWKKSEPLFCRAVAKVDDATNKVARRFDLQDFDSMAHLKTRPGRHCFLPLGLGTGKGSYGD